MTADHAFIPEDPSTPGDGEIAQLAAELVRNQTDGVTALFRGAGARAPTLLWRPSLLDLQHPVLRGFMRASGSATPVPEAFVESEEFAALSDWAMILEEAPGEGEYRYIHYGSGIAESYGQDLTGKRVSEIGGHISVFFRALYSAAAQRRQIVKSVHEPPRQVFVMAWRRLIVPLADARGDVRRFAVANVPDNPLRAGLDILPDPVLIVTEPGRVCCANRAACLEFGRPRGLSGETSLEDWIGAPLPLKQSPDQIILRGAAEPVTVTAVRDRKIVHYTAVIGATYYREFGFFVIHIRPETRTPD